MSKPQATKGDSWAESWAPDGLVLAGFALLLIGLAGFDWRLAFIVGGSLLLALGVLTAWRQSAAGPAALPRENQENSRAREVV